MFAPRADTQVRPYKGLGGGCGGRAGDHLRKVPGPPPKNLKFCLYPAAWISAAGR